MAGDLGWSFDLLSTFRIQDLVVLTSALIVLLLAKRWWASAFIGVFVAVNVAAVVVFLPWKPQATSSADIRLALFNVNAANRDARALTKFVRSESPDLVALLEIDERWRTDLQELDEFYPHQFWHTRPDNFGIALLSRWPIPESRIVGLDASGVPTLVTEIEASSGTVSMVATHPPPPVSPEQWEIRNEHFENLGALVQTLPRPIVIAGDLNVAPWPIHFRRLLHISVLIDSARGRGLHPTWPVRHSPAPGPPWLLATVLDYVLHSADLETVYRFTGPDIGGDHLPVSVGLAFAR